MNYQTHYQPKIYLDVPCKNYDKCGNIVSREQSQTKRGINFICPECREKQQRQYARKQYLMRRKMELTIRKKMLTEGKSMTVILKELTV